MPPVLRVFVQVLRAISDGYDVRGFYYWWVGWGALRVLVRVRGAGAGFGSPNSLCSGWAG